MTFEHVPVLFNEVIDSLDIKADGTYMDGTVGGAGHSSGICEKLSKSGHLVAVDRDNVALETARARLEKFDCNKTFIHANYSDVDKIKAEVGAVDGILLDLGVSSYQLDTAERGFSYMHDAPMDMRMNEDDMYTAATVVNEYPESELFRIIKEHGEERWASRIAKFIVKARAEEKIETTGQLVDVIKAAFPASARRTGPHPAKRTFQAIRIEVNGELEHLKLAMEKLPELLAPGGRMSVITFHSLEDRIVKDTFNNLVNPCTCPPELPVCVCGKVADVRKVTRKPIIASEQELKDNPRARSAKLRVIEKI